MPHAGKRTVGTVAIGLLVAMLVASVFGASILAVPHAGASTQAGASHAMSLGSATHPAAVKPSVTTTASIVTTTTPAKYQPIPFGLGLTITVTGSSINVTTTKIWVTLVDDVLGTFCGSVSANQSILPGITSYNVSLGPIALTPALAKCPGIAIHGTDIQGNVMVDNSAFGGTVATNTTLVLVTDFIFNPLTAALVSPAGSVGAGNISLMALYTAQYVDSVTMVITSPAGAVVFNSSLAWSGPSTPTVATWFESTPGTYHYTLTVTTAYQTLPMAGTITVLPGAGTPVYENSSTWQNSSIFPGVTGAVSGTILLVVGLILGMIVALAVGRSLMRPAAAAPAQPWQPSGTGANACSVCGKSFATPEELKEHAKTEHGMN